MEAAATLMDFLIYIDRRSCPNTVTVTVAWLALRGVASCGKTEPGRAGFRFWNVIRESLARGEC